MRRIVWVALGLLVAGCGQNPEAVLLGHWTGGFDLKSGAPTEYSGYVHLYATGHSFKLELKSRDQTLSDSGTWSLRGRTVTLENQDVESDQPDQDVVFAKKLQVIDLDLVRSQLGREIILHGSADWQTLEGLSLTLGKKEGHFVFHHIVRPAGSDRS
jgi:hypothetical protein